VHYIEYFLNTLTYIKVARHSEFKLNYNLNFIYLYTCIYCILYYVKVVSIEKNKFEVVENEIFLKLEF